MLALVTRDHRPDRKNVDGETVGWKAVINMLTMYYGNRITINT
jgi:hypothetical protein